MTPAQSITFALSGDAARITRRAAETLKLAIVDLPDGTFRVVLRESVDAYRLGNLTACDPAWARAFLQR